MYKLFIASSNPGKIKEIKECLTGLNIEFFSMLDSGNFTDIEETGNSFEENAFLKAKVVFDIVKTDVIADDSGLEVDFLNGEPGIYSARYSGTGATDEKNCRKLLDALADVRDESLRGAQFRCVIALYDGISKRSFEGICRGKINFEPKGSGGFGYDPLFVPAGFDRTFAEMDPKTKNSISHRGKALKSLADFLKIELGT
ncbi:XTP/dITP diphosphohydrolase [uncultured bacterium]|nr:XTP/dITP diphosphohydrolase [uncultured bacterium]